MKIAIVIPTYDRYKKLSRCINSILQNTYQDFVIYPMCDNNDIDTYKKVNEANFPQTYPVFCNKQLYAPGCWNSFSANFYICFNWDAMLWLCDDTELRVDTLEKAVDCFIKNYPDTDGMMGIAQWYPKETSYCKSGQSILGRKFLARFPKQQSCCPDYLFAHQDAELMEFALSINKFAFCDSTDIIHYHPSFYPDEMDSTHALSRGDIVRNDKITRKIRQEKGLVWGKTWQLVNNFRR